LAFKRSGLEGQRRSGRKATGNVDDRVGRAPRLLRDACDVACLLRNREVCLHDRCVGKGRLRFAGVPSDGQKKLTTLVLEVSREDGTQSTRRATDDGRSGLRAAVEGGIVRQRMGGCHARSLGGLAFVNRSSRYPWVMDDPATVLAPLLARARSAQRTLPEGDRDGALRAIARRLRERGDDIVAANAEDVRQEEAKGTSAALLDRLRLTPSRVEALSTACEQVADLPDPLHRVLRGWRLEAGPDVREVTVPFGVIGMIYESRPNVTVDAAILALKTGSAAVLRGSASALVSNRILVEVMQRGLEDAGLPREAVQLIDSPDRAFVGALLSARGAVDLVIPRGGASLIQHVVETATVPVIETGVGVCHLYVHEAADLEMAEGIAVNAKVQRPGVCNAIETMLVDAAVAEVALPRLASALQAEGVELRGCARTKALVPSVLPARDEDWGAEYLDLILAVRVVDDFEAAREHIAQYGTQHSEVIVTGDREVARRFQRKVDAATVYVNASTRFTDGFEFGFGAEIGISTQKLHARGPMGLAQLVTTKYLLDGQGETRG